MRTTPRPVGLLVAAFLVASASPALAMHPSVKERRGLTGSAKSVVALIDTGINPYSAAFRDRSKLARTHPSKYIRGFPKKAKALHLSLGLPYEKAIKRDAKVWKRVERNRLYWIPGTRIAGAISLGAGGTNCPLVPAPPANSVGFGCEEHLILDDHGHGTMTSSRAAGAPRSLAPRARIVMIEGLGAQSTRWAAEAGWIDVQSNSWVSLVPPLPNSVSQAFEWAAERMLTLAASGNGTAYLAGVAPTPTYLLSTAPPGVVLVGGHDNGKVTAWAGAPPHVVADAYAGETALAQSTGGMRPHPMACCTSAASPYAAGGAAAIVLEARRLLDDATTGSRGGLVACGHPDRKIRKGPLADGSFTLHELKRVLFRTAEAHPGKGRDDGLVHWAGGLRPPDYVEYGVGANPFCAGCTTMPVDWKALPNEVDTYQFTGYGGINERSVALAKRVLRGKARLPKRPEADAQYDLDQQIREAEFSLNDFGSKREMGIACAVSGHGHSF